MANKMSNILPMSPLTIVSDYSPAGDQPTAIKGLVEGLQNGLAGQTLLGVTGKPVLQSLN